MDQKKMEKEGKLGRLPAMAPLANPYVPFQLENSPKYEARKGLIRGTLFPGLDLPFMGMQNNMEKPATPLTEIQAVGFALQELALYLDTHREDQEALEMYRQYQQIYHDAMMNFAKNGTAMSHSIPDCAKDYAWLDDPWPWEYGKM